MELTIKELQVLISAQKAISGAAHFGAFRDGFIAAWDILNTYLKMKMPKCSERQKTLSEEEHEESMDNVCDECYRKAQDETYNERQRNEP